MDPPRIAVVVLLRWRGCVCHVLIIEDEALIALDLQWLLEGAGASTFSFAVSQEEAVTAARTHRPDIITSDVRLVQGTGPAAVEEIRETLGDIPVVFISATRTNGCGEDRITRSLSKPLNRPAVVSAFRELRELACV